MFAQDALWPGLDLAKGDGFKTARTFKPEGEAANSGKEIQNLELARHSLADEI